MVTTAEPLVSAQSSVSGALFYPLLIISAALWAFHYYRQRSRFVQLGNKLPGPPPLPYIGNSHMLLGLRNSEQIMKKALEIGTQYNKIARAWLGHRLIVFLLDPRDAEIILSSQVHLEKSPEYVFFKPWLGNGLLISSGDKWRTHRKLIAPAFHLNVLKSFIGLFNKNSKQLVDKMRKEIGETKTFDIHDYVIETAVETLLETAMGVKKSEEGTGAFDYAMAVMRMCDIMHHRITKVWLRSNFLNNLIGFGSEEPKLVKAIHTLSNKVFRRKKQEFEQLKKEGKIKSIIVDPANDGTDGSTSGTYFDLSRAGLKDDLDVDDDVGEKKRMAFLDLLIESKENGAHISDQEIKEQVDTIMFEGHDTTAAGTSFILCCLGAHPEIQDKVVQELYEIFGNSDRPATFADTLEMKYLERVILESLRLFPPVPIIARHLKEDVKLASGDYIVPAGTTIVIGTYKIHRSPDIYPNPDQFNPDNFLPEKMASRHYYSFIPFSAGPRSCVGRKYAMLKIKIMLSTILRNFKVVSDIKHKDFRLQGDIILKRSDGFQVKLEERGQLVAAQ